MKCNGEGKGQQERSVGIIPLKPDNKYEDDVWFVICLVQI